MAQNRYHKNLQKFIENRERLDEDSRQGVIHALRLASPQISAAFPSLTRISLVGSIVKGGYSKTSDVDIVVAGLKKRDYFRLKSCLETKLKKSVDLIMEEELSEKDAAYILSKQEVIYGPGEEDS